MDELEFRRRIMSDPKQRDSEISAAIKESEQNAQFADEILDLDKQIAKAMAVDVPEDLADKILFNQTSVARDNVVRPNFARRAMAMAASVAFVAGLLVGQLNWSNLVVSPAQASLATTALQHVVDEKPFVQNLDEQVKSSQINAKMMPFDHQLSETFPYHVYYLNHCGFGKSNALHMVFRGEKGKVTLFLTGIPSNQTVDFNEDGMTGVVEPMGDTSMIIVGDEGEDVAKIAESISKIIKPMT
ncbi:DUF3379 domain-containing protein [Vibrio europaeus]|uniref:Chemotaxis protein n=1 Tax=Vibrio europaeus TaxID=300876 RepID=A0A178JDC8_9VIBR|nr:DUF3379 domain-containing protein [Vibrio europaeus]MDC5703653.1 DUF3379 domain-containing protein [Vibrio europaeus]MDC5711192.1 DUF3379 domain-containing protein [Vibrio europaeus]MDC5714685.1 DUF3379 domain-containing protein [Vibrio europaeus]MDC5722415.1 DUF3379 domain-containing protein [Vibrio europaeus]MDC5727304.1 DUF3379 domain-containing protein [Vibrio europaeus]